MNPRVERQSPAGREGWLMERAAYLHLESYAGHSKSLVIVIGETRTRYRIITPIGTARVRLAGMCRYLTPGKTALVPKRAVSFIQGARERRMNVKA